MPKNIAIITYFLILLLLFTFSCYAQLPDSEDVNLLTELSQLTADVFYQETLETRMAFEFSDDFFTEEDKLLLYTNAQRTLDHLTDVSRQLNDIKNKIEAHQGDDWEQRFGRTGLWRKVSQQLFTTKLNACSIKFYIALSAPKKKQQPFTVDLLKKIDELEKENSSNLLKLIRAKTFALINAENPRQKLKLQKQLQKLSLDPHINKKLNILITIEALKLTNRPQDEKLIALARDIIKSSYKSDPHIVLPAAFLLRKHNKTEQYKLMLESDPRIRKLASNITLRWLTEGNNTTNPLDAELAAQAAINKNPEKYSTLLLRLAESNTAANPLVDFAAAMAIADTNDPLAVNLLINVSNIHADQPCDFLKSTPRQISTKAVELAYKIFLNDSNQCDLTHAAFENYFDLAGDEPKPKIIYTYAQVLTLCGQADLANKWLMKIPPESGIYWKKARLDLLSAFIPEALGGDMAIRASLLLSLTDLLTEINSCTYSDPISTLLHSCLEDIEILESETDIYDKTISDAKIISKFIYNCKKNRTNIAILAEYSALDSKTNKKQLALIRSIFIQDQNDTAAVDTLSLRALARVSQRNGQFDDAATLWGMVVKANTSKNNTSKPAWKWWRAKYYHLLCSFNTSTPKMDIEHVIDVLLASNENIPAPWQQKLQELKQKCHVQF